VHLLEFSWKAQCALNWGHLEEARALATQAIELLPSRSSWLRSETLHHAHQLLGLLDLKNNDRYGATEHLLASAQIESIPSFGPSMQLAEALLRLGEREAALEYFEACRRFWGPGETRLKEWSRQVRESQIPDFGFNSILSSRAPPC